MRSTRLVIPLPVQAFLRDTVASTGGNEVYFLGRVSWGSEGPDRVATLEEVDVLARGNRVSVPAIVERAEEWDIAIHNHPGGDLEPSDADIGVASELGSRSVGFAIISDDATRHYLVTAPFERRVVVPLDPEEVRAIFAPGGPLARGCEGYEAREGQVEMALEVTRALSENLVLAAEAGTGIGKSFAYLVPAILWAVRNAQRVVVSTGTINLQEQLVSKDLPLLRSVLPVEFRFALAKGRNNYACLRKVEEVAADLRQPTFLPDSDDRRALEDLVSWATSTGEGSRADLSWIPPPAAWEEVMSETDKSLKVNCPHYQECFYYKAKRTASSAHIVVANHHLFFADLAVRRETNNYQYDAVLPAYRRVVFDEAHHLEDVASEHLGVRFTRGGVLVRLWRLRSQRTPHRGTIPTIASRLRREGDGVAAQSIERTFGGGLPDVLLRDEAHFDAIEAAAAGAGRRRPDPAEEADAEGALADSRPQEPEGTVQIRYRRLEEDRPFWDLVSGRLHEIQKELAIVLAMADRALATLRGARIGEEKRRGLILELTSAAGRLEGFIDQLERFRDFEDAALVRWLERRPPYRQGGHSLLDFGAAPIRVAEELKEHVFDPLHSVVLTSATLSVAGDPAFLAERLGLSLVDPERFSFRQHASPFDYRKQVLTLVPADLPPPESQEYAKRLPDAVLRILRSSGGRAFVLFTSYGMLRRTYAALEGPLTELGLRPSKQGDAERSELLRRFRAGISNVLFATDSFWEGVDVKGRALECVIITRLPFRVPSEPIQEARLEDLQARGLNPFTHFTVPQAVLKFKQGFGRLIRAKTDRGVVAVLDTRILTKSYGRIFLRSLPETDFRKLPLDALEAEVEAFLAAAS